jgi:hypothetical protein
LLKACPSEPFSPTSVHSFTAEYGIEQKLASSSLLRIITLALPN